jgi:molybdate transport system substrate-binding protein
MTQGKPTSITNVRIAIAFAALAMAAALAGCGGGGSGEPAPLYCYVGGTMRPAMEELARIYQEETGRRVELDYGDSGAAIIKAETTGRGDLTVVHDPFHGAFEHKGLSADAWVVATLQPVIAVAKGNPKSITGLKDLARPGLRLILTDAMYSTAGHVNTVMFRRAGIEAEVAKNVVAGTRMGGEAANAVVLGTADATIVWNAVAFLRRDKLDAIPIEAAYRPDPGVDATTSATFGPINLAQIRVTIDVLKSSKQADAARAFAQFAASPRAAEVWRKLGFGPATEPAHLAPAGSVAATEAKTGSLYVYAGAALMPALHELIQAFTAKTGTTVETDYGGSGMLISRLRLARRGDIFMPGDIWYVETAEKEGLVSSKTTICWFVPVILVPKGNPKGIRGLADLAKPGVRLGLGNPDACTVGKTCQEIFAKNRMDKAAIEKNIVFSSVTVNELGLQIKAGKLDATIVWDAIAAMYADCGEVIAIPPAENIVSQVSAAVLKSSADPARAEEFVKFIKSMEGQATLRKHQYRTEAP